jgi:hypothetical protein
MNLSTNQLVTIIIKEIKSTDNEVLSLLQTTFVSKLTPMYSTPLKIREIAGSFITDVSDDILNQLILKYSVEADMLATCDTVMWDKWQFYASKWVALKVAVDAIYNSEMYITTTNKGKTYKKLGDFSVSTDLKTRDPIDYVKKFLTKLECEIFKLNVSIRLCKEPLIECDADLLEDIASSYNVPAQTVIKGGSVPGRPIFGRGFAQRGQHPQWTGWLTRNNRKEMTNYVNYNVPGYRDTDQPLDPPAGNN